MKAVQFDRYGDIDVLHVADVPVPEPAQGQVLVKVKAASINPGEAKIREGVFHKVWPATFPSGEGSDLAGIVTHVAPALKGSRPGTRSSVSPTGAPATPSMWSSTRRTSRASQRTYLGKLLGRSPLPEARHMRLCVQYP